MMKQIHRREFVKLAASAGAALSVGGTVSCVGAYGQTSARRSAESIDERAIRDFAAGMQGPVLRPVDNEYELARQIFNSRFDRRPGLIARCANSADVQRCVDFARSERLLVAVRGGGHSPAGYSTCDDGLVIDLSRMKWVGIDRERKVVRAEAGLVTSELNVATEKAEIALVLGGCSSVGIGGFTLGGGYGVLTSKFGVSCDNLVWAEVVLADGRVVSASAEENADLFWALRGGGGSFGIATAFRLRAHPLTQIVGGRLIYDPSQARDVMRAYRDFAASVPDELNAGFSFGALQGPPQFALGVAYAGDMTSATPVLQTLRSFATPKEDTIRPVSYHRFHLSDSPPANFRPAAKVTTGFLEELSDEAIDRIAAVGGEVPSMAQMSLGHLHGAPCRVPLTATAFPLRSAGYECWAVANWSQPAQRAAGINWLGRVWDAVSPHVTGAYVNMLSEDQSEQIKPAYGTLYTRLAALKRKYDPDNLFSLNPLSSVPES